jgi:hypothetical protein
MLRKSGMNALPKLLLAITAAVALSFAHPVKANLITNPGFETGDFTGWTAVGGSVVGMYAGESTTFWQFSGSIHRWFP